MMFATPIEMGIYHDTEESKALDLIDNPYNLKDAAEIREYTFYNIENVFTYKFHGYEYGAVSSNGTTYISVLSYKELKQLVNKHSIQHRNFL